jgi:hypothetical protein
MTLVPDRTCRLKFPVAAQKLIEYSAARHGEHSWRTLAGKLGPDEGKVSPSPRKSACPRAKQRDVATPWRQMADLPLVSEKKNPRPSCFIHLFTRSNPVNPLLPPLPCGRATPVRCSRRLKRPALFIGKNRCASVNRDREATFDIRLLQARKTSLGKRARLLNSSLKPSRVVLVFYLPLPSARQP